MINRKTVNIKEQNLDRKANTMAIWRHRTLVLCRTPGNVAHTLFLSTLSLLSFLPSLSVSLFPSLPLSISLYLIQVFLVIDIPLRILPWPCGSVGWSSVLYMKRFDLIPGKCTYRGCRFDPQLGHIWKQPIHVSNSFSLPLSPPLLSSL